MTKEQEIIVIMSKIMITQLGTIQDTYYAGVVKELNIDDSKSWLFDYLYNGSLTETFPQYLERVGINFESLLKND
jgi:hypothetical protein